MIVFSNVLIPDFTGRAVGFVPEDLEVASGLDDLMRPSRTSTHRSRKGRQAKHLKKTARQREQEARDSESRAKDKRCTAFTTQGISQAGHTHIRHR